MRIPLRCPNKVVAVDYLQKIAFRCLLKVYQFHWQLIRIWPFFAWRMSSFFRKCELRIFSTVRSKICSVFWNFFVFETQKTGSKFYVSLNRFIIALTRRSQLTDAFFFKYVYNCVIKLFTLYLLLIGIPWTWVTLNDLHSYCTKR